MKKLLALFLLFALCLSLCVGCTPANGGDETDPSETTAAEDSTPTFTLRIEGNEKNIYYGELDFVAGTNLKDALVMFDESNDEVNFVGATEDYITSVNGETAAKFDGWDGWCIMVNGVSPSAAASGVELADGDEVVLYYGDPWGVGMIYPTVRVKGNRIVFTNEKEPIVGMTVILNGEDFVTDSEGAVTGLEAGEYTVQVRMFADNGLNIVYRFAPDYKVKISG